MSYKNDVREYVAANPDASGPEVAEACGCSISTVYRHWTNGDSSTGDVDAGDVDADPEDDTTDVDAGDLEDDQDDQEDADQEDADQQDDDPEDDAPQASFDDPPAKDYRCGDCGHAIEYLDRKCGGCGEQLMWSAIEEAAE